VQSRELVQGVIATHWLFTQSLLDGLAQSDAERQATHCPRSASQAGPVDDVAQSALVEHPACPPQTPLTQVTPSEQSTSSKHCTHFDFAVSQSNPASLHWTSELQEMSGVEVAVLDDEELVSPPEETTDVPPVPPLCALVPPTVPAPDSPPESAEVLRASFQVHAEGMSAKNAPIEMIRDSV
jgi:hypothetical protein